MHTQVEFQDEFTIVRISGKLDINKSLQFKKACLESLRGQKVIFSLENLNFVGSTGIINFFQTIKEVHEINNGDCKIVGLNADFKKIVHLANIETLNFYESLDQAQRGLPQPVAIMPWSKPGLEIQTEVVTEVTAGPVTRESDRSS